MNKQTNGFTVIEIVFVALIMGIASVLFFIQKNELEISHRDNTAKTAINAMYYSLEEVFYTANKFYPQSISTDNLKSVDPVLFTDSNGIKLGSVGSTYIYKPTNCNDNRCKSYTLKAILENEADYIKKSINN